MWLNSSYDRGVGKILHKIVAQLLKKRENGISCIDQRIGLKVNNMPFYIF
jgi:hypothetical protein